jgi:hypothetical protein
MVNKQQDAFNPNISPEEIRIAEAKMILIKAGYKIVDPLVVNENVNNQSRLLNYFYMRLFTRYPEKQLTTIKNFQKDGKLISKFVEARKVDMDEQAAIQECVAIIDVIFDYGYEFKFRHPITIGVLGQAKSGWITEKAVSILNRELVKKDEEEVERRMKEVEDGYEEKVDLKKTANRLDEILAKMEESNG